MSNSSLGIQIIIICVMPLHDNGLSGMNIIYMIRIFLYMASVSYLILNGRKLTKYTLWTNSVHLTDSYCFIHGPFNFDSLSDIVSAKQFIVLSDSEFLFISCNTLCIIPPLISTLINTFPKKKMSKRVARTQLYFGMQIH